MCVWGGVVGRDKCSVYHFTHFGSQLINKYLKICRSDQFPYIDDRFFPHKSNKSVPGRLIFDVLMYMWK